MRGADRQQSQMFKILVGARQGAERSSAAGDPIDGLTKCFPSCRAGLTACTRAQAGQR